MRYESSKLVKYFETIKKKEIELTQLQFYTFYKLKSTMTIKINNLSSILGEKVNYLRTIISYRVKQ